MSSRASTDQPNIILINCDDLGYGDLGCYGSTLNATPTLDRLAAQGTRFTDFYMASPVCTPSRGAMMTGCYPARIGFHQFDGRGVLFPGMPHGLHQDERTIAAILRDRGYNTKLVGKWHCGDQPEFLPTNRGFESYYGIPYSNDMGRQLGREEQLPPLPLVRDEAVIQQQPDQCALTERYTEESVRFIRENRDQPFFLYLAHMYVHLPIYVQDRFLRESRNGRYGAAVATIDWCTAVIERELQDLGILENTLFLFTSDNGSRINDEGGSNGDLRGTKGTVWEGGIRLPLIAYWPGTIQGGATCSEVATSMDLLPTLAGLAGAQAPTDRPIDGRDIAPLLRAEPDARSPHDAFFYYTGGHLRAVRSGDWKLHVGDARGRGHECEGPLLYNLRDDLGETRNVLDAHPDIVAQLETALDGCREDIGDDSLDVTGTNRRAVGRVDDPAPLTTFDPDYPYYMAEYDLSEAG